jgi:hypothetical protein
MDSQRRDEVDERDDYEAPELITLASVEEATLMGLEGATSDGTFTSGSQ